jgi:hypothetical protein
VTTQLNLQTDTSVLRYRDKCDKYDYLIAVACGTISGLIDAFLVGSPGNSVLGTWTDAQVDNCVKAFAKMNGWNPHSGNEDSVASAIDCLGKKFSVNYDQSTSDSVNGLFTLSAKNHHMKSLAHSPSPVGLFFSILNQFTSTSTFLSNGQFITIQTETFELQGKDFISKLFCGIANWIGHLMSDIAGHQNSRRDGGRGSGIVMPFYELFGLCNFGSFGEDKLTLAELATKAFENENSYDARFGLTMAIPVILCETSIRLIWGIRQYFQFKRPLKECIPTEKHDSLRVMLLFCHGSLCLVDGVDAAIRSGGNPLAFFLRMNLVAWCRLLRLVLKEICIRTGISFELEREIEAFKRINEALAVYLAELEKIDFEAFERETKACAELARHIDGAQSEEQLNFTLKQAAKDMGVKFCWEETHDSFDSFMSDKNAVMRFE